MAQFQEALVRDTVLVVGAPRLETFSALNLYADEYEKKIKIVVIADRRRLKTLQRINKLKESKEFKLLVCNFSSPADLKKCIDPIASSLLAVTAQFENVIPDFKKLLPHVPYLHTPTSESLEWSTDKVKMRRLLKAFDPKITPKFHVVKEVNQDTIEKVVKNVGFPLIVKPNGLAGSRLVTACYHEDELEKALKNISKKIEAVFKKTSGNGEPQILVEQMMEGSMYSVDAYVNDRGNMYFLPPVHVKTGRAIGFDDYFGYQRITPTKLKRASIEEANAVCRSAIRALGMRSTTCHIELIKGVNGWRIIELGPRQGGFRHKMYAMAFGINHILNDILIRIPQKPIISKKRKGFCAVLQIYAKQEGFIGKIRGLSKVKKLDSFEQISQNKKLGDKTIFARNGGTSVFDITLFNKDRSKLLADIRRIEKNLVVVVGNGNKTK